VGDCVRPLKQHLEAYRVTEDGIQRAIDERFGVYRSSHQKALIKQADNEALRIEAREVMASKGEHWDWGTADFVATAEVHCWSTDRSLREFLSRLSLYCEEVV
jgi:hypothetical protein